MSQDGGHDVKALHKLITDIQLALDKLMDEESQDIIQLDQPSATIQLNDLPLDKALQAEPANTSELDPIQEAFGSLLNAKEFLLIRLRQQKVLLINPLRLFCKNSRSQECTCRDPLLRPPYLLKWVTISLALLFWGVRLMLALSYAF